MNRFALARAGLRHGRRRHLGLLLGATLTTAIFVGALAVGDSVKESLRRQSLQRIGAVRSALDAGDRFVTTTLAGALADGGREVSAVLRLAGVAVTPDGRHRANGVQVLGVDAAFSRLSEVGGGAVTPPAGTVSLNRRLARQLVAGPGDTLVLRVEKPSALPRETALGDPDDLVTALRVTVGPIRESGAGGAFSLQAHQIPPYNAIVDRDWLARELGLDGRANLLLTDGDATTAGDELRTAWTLDDLELSFAERGALAGLVSRRVFLDDAVEAAIREGDVRGLAASTTFVRAIRSADGPVALPYSTVTGLGVIGDAPPDAARDAAALVSANLGADGVVLHDAAAERLGIGAGDSLTLDVWTLGDDLRLGVGEHRLTVDRVVPLAGAADDPTWMPAFPGLEDKQSCRDWDPSVPVDLNELSPWDEAYWAEHQGTPKAFVRLETARTLWGSRFGTLTEVRVAATDRAELERSLLRRVDPATLGLRFEDVRETALAAGHTATDFGGLFFGLSLFLVVSAVMLMTLVFVFGVEQRAREIGVLRAIGFRPSQLRNLFLAEAMLVAALGVIPGVALGALYTQLVLRGLATLWSEAVAEASLTYHAGATSLVGGPIAALLVAVCALAWAVRRHVRSSAAALLAGRAAEPPGAGRPGRGALGALVVGAGAAVVFAVLATRTDGPTAAGLAFGAGAALLVAGLAAARLRIASLGRGTSRSLTLFSVGVRSAGRRPGRSLAVVGLLASGVFLVVSVGVHRLTAPEGAQPVTSGTGGYALYAESTVRLRHDLDAPESADAFGLDDDATAFDSLPLRVRDGDEASCLNLSSSQNPLLVGAPAEALAARGAFTFSAVEGDVDAPWRLLENAREDGAVPAIGDAASVTWALHKGVGDTLAYVDERGQPFDVRIVATVTGSILQGMLLIDDAAFRARFPAEGGFRRFLIDLPDGGAEDGGVALSAELTAAFGDVGLEVTKTSDRLAAYQAVQNTYLAIFQTLGALGVLLGTTGLALVVLRNLFERRGELATLRAVGFSRRRLGRLLLAEHGVLLGLGALIGAAAALGAVLPLGREASSHAPWIVVVAVVLTGLAAVSLAVALATRGRLVDALTTE